MAAGLVGLVGHRSSRRRGPDPILPSQALPKPRAAICAPTPFGDAGELPLREWVANALYNKGVRLGALGRGEEAVAAYDDLLARFGAAAEPALRERVARAKSARDRLRKP